MGVSVNPKLNGTPIDESEQFHTFGASKPAATDRDGICAAQVRTGAGELVLDGQGVAGGVYAAGFDGGRLITVYSGGDISGCTITITGTDAFGAAQTEDLAGPNNGTTTGTKYFQTVTAVSSDATLGTNAEVGFAASLVVLNLARGTHFQLAPTNAENYKIAIYGGTGGGIKNRCSLKITNPASGTVTWADGTTPSDTRVYFPGGTEPTVTASGTDWFDFAYDVASASGDAVWYCVNQAQDLKP